MHSDSCDQPPVTQYIPQYIVVEHGKQLRLRHVCPCVWLCQRQYESYLTVHTPPTPWTLFKNPLATCCLSLDLRVFQSVESHAHYDRKCHPVSMSSWEERVCVQLLLIEVELSSGIRLSAQLPELMLFGKENLMLEHISAANTQLSYGKLIPLIFLY